MKSANKNTRRLQDFTVNVKYRLSGLWITVMLCYIYGDIFSLFVPGRIRDIINGNWGFGTTTPLKLLIASIMMAIPAAMIFLSLVLKPKINRWINIIFGTIYTVIMILTILDSINPWWVFYIFLGVVELVITSIIVWQAWNWPTQ